MKKISDKEKQRILELHHKTPMKPYLFEQIQGQNPKIYDKTNTPNTISPRPKLSQSEIGSIKKFVDDSKFIPLNQIKLTQTPSFKNNTEGDEFRLWVNTNFKDIAGHLKLSSKATTSDGFKNIYIQMAWNYPMISELDNNQGRTLGQIYSNVKFNQENLKNALQAGVEYMASDRSDKYYPSVPPKQSNDENTDYAKKYPNLFNDEYFKTTGKPMASVKTDATRIDNQNLITLKTVIDPVSGRPIRVVDPLSQNRDDGSMGTKAEQEYILYRADIANKIKKWDPLGNWDIKEAIDWVIWLLKWIGPSGKLVASIVEGARGLVYIYMSYKSTEVKDQVIYFIEGIAEWLKILNRRLIIPGISDLITRIMKFLEGNKIGQLILKYGDDINTAFNDLSKSSQTLIMILTKVLGGDVLNDILKTILSYVLYPLYNMLKGWNESMASYLLDFIGMVESFNKLIKTSKIILDELDPVGILNTKRT